MFFLTKLIFLGVNHTNINVSLPNSVIAPRICSARSAILRTVDTRTRYIVIFPIGTTSAIY